MARLSHRLEYGLLRAVAWVLERLRLDTARRIGAWLGRLGYSPLGIRRDVVERQLAGAFPGLGANDVQELARRSYSHLGRMAIELTLLRSLGRERVGELFEQDNDFALIEEAVRGGRGCVLFTGHVGNWELTGAYVAWRGLDMDVVVRRMANPLFDGYLNRTRARLGMRVVYDSDAVRAIPRAIRDGRVVGLVADQGVLGLASTYVPFFGRPAKTPRGPAVFAIRFNVPIIFCAAILQPSGRYRFTAQVIPVADTGIRDADIDETVRRFTQTLERVVRRHPEQYFWHHRRWKRQPADTPPELRDPVKHHTPTA
jgi:KDO2-lipid IV(A) lauroyltransferase